MTTDPKPVTEEELAEWEQYHRDGADVLEDQRILRLIAALREARKAEEYWHDQAYLMEGKANDTEKELREARAEATMRGDKIRQVLLEQQDELVEFRRYEMLLAEHTDLQAKLADMEAQLREARAQLEELRNGR